MGSKRPRLHDIEDDEQGSSHQERKRPKKRVRRNNHDAPRPSTAVNHIKHKIRDLKRTLERSENLPADVRVEKERALAGYKLDLEKNEHEKRKQQMIKKYHMVRFFERQKATRRLKRLKTRLTKTEQESEEYIDLKEKIHRADVDLNYTLYCPLAEKYTSLYKSTEDAGNSNITHDDSMISQGSESLVHRPPMWSVVEDCMAEGTLWALRDRKLGHPVAGATGTERAPVETQNSSQRIKKSAPQRREKRVMMKHSSIPAKDDNSEDGFFEQ
ncbi:MAG: hypothetical protein Q9195_000858 [Heterodermia aff. obscurata]